MVFAGPLPLTCLNEVWLASGCMRQANLQEAKTHHLGDGRTSARGPLHRDPFARLLLARAEREGLLLIAADQSVARFPGPVRHRDSF